MEVMDKLIVLSVLMVSQVCTPIHQVAYVTYIWVFISQPFLDRAYFFLKKENNLSLFEEIECS